MSWDEDKPKWEQDAPGVWCFNVGPYWAEVYKSKDMWIAAACRVREGFTTQSTSTKEEAQEKALKYILRLIENDYRRLNDYYAEVEEAIYTSK